MRPMKVYAITRNFTVAPHAAAAPISAEIIACDSLVGIPKTQAPTASIITDASAAQSAASPVFGAEKSAHSKMFFATELFINVIINTPARLHTAAVNTAFFIESVLLQTQLTMAFGASVQPFTNITPSVSNAAVSVGGDETADLKKSKMKYPI